MATINHLHTYEKIMLDGNVVYRCLHPDCTLVTQKVLIMGKRAMCACGEPYILTNELLRRKRPHCEKCFKTERGERARKAASLTKRIVRSDANELTEVLNKLVS